MEHSKKYRNRIAMKPIMERKRRARINKCLDDLKALMVECLKQEGEHITRLEKADILELTVNYMKKLNQQKILNLSPFEGFRTGYIKAADEVSKVLATTPGIDINLGTNLMTHLGHKLNQLQQYQSLFQNLQEAGMLNLSQNQCMTTQGQITSEKGHQPKQKHYQQHFSKISGTPSNINKMEYMESTCSIMSPASSGYHSDGEYSNWSTSPEVTVKTSKNSNEAEQSSNNMWRPW